MKLSKYRLTFNGLQGAAVVVYEENLFKSLLIDVQPPFNDGQFKWLMAHLPKEESMLGDWVVMRSQGKVQLEPVVPEGTNKVIGLFCSLYKEKFNVAYKVLASDAGKIKALKATDLEWTALLTTYFDTDTFAMKNKSIGNLVRYWNELRVETFGKKQPVKKAFPLPYDHLFFVKLDMTGQKEYWEYLRQNGYVYEVNEGRVGKWVKKTDLIK